MPDIRKSRIGSQKDMAKLLSSGISTNKEKKTTAEQDKRII